jgi:hypothetical protein
LIDGLNLALFYRPAPARPNIINFQTDLSQGLWLFLAGEPLLAGFEKAKIVVTVALAGGCFFLRPLRQFLPGKLAQQLVQLLAPVGRHPQQRFLDQNSQGR